AANTANSLRLYRTGGGLVWAAKAMFPWRYPRFSADNRLAVANEGGDLTIFDAVGKRLYERDLGALAMPAFLPSGDLIAATWNGRFLRISRDYSVLWRTRVMPGAADIR